MAHSSEEYQQGNFLASLAELFDAAADRQQYLIDCGLFERRIKKLDKFLPKEAIKEDL